MDIFVSTAVGLTGKCWSSDLRGQCLKSSSKVKIDQEISMMMIEVRGLQMDAVVVKMEDCFVIIDELA